MLLHFILHLQVSLGKVNELYKADSDAGKLPVGWHSVKGVGRIRPRPSGNVIWWVGREIF